MAGQPTPPNVPPTRNKALLRDLCVLSIMVNHQQLQNPCKSKDYFLNVFSVKTIILVGIYNQQFQGTIILMVFDLQGIYI